MFLPALCICTMCLSGAYEGQKGALDPEIVESRVVVSRDVCAEN